MDTNGDMFPRTEGSLLDDDVFNFLTITESLDSATNHKPRRIVKRSKKSLSPFKVQNENKETTIVPNEPSFGAEVTNNAFHFSPSIQSGATIAVPRFTVVSLAEMRWDQFNRVVQAPSDIGGDVFAYGDNLYGKSELTMANVIGQLGQGDQQSKNSAHPVGFLQGKNIHAMAAGGEHSLALTQNGAVFAFGSNQQGQRKLFV
jgi:hypothetical protein